MLLADLDGVVRLQPAASSVDAGMRTAALLPHFRICWFAGLLRIYSVDAS
jgi:hypothetical protein